MIASNRRPPEAETRLLLVEPQDRDAGWIERMVGSSGGLTLRRARNLGDVLTYLERWPFDLCLIDPDLPAGSGLDIVRLLRDRRPEVPVIATSRRLDLGFDLDLQELGAADLLDKSRLQPPDLQRCLRYARARAREAARLDQLVRYDELTGLANRAVFQDRLDRALAYGRRHQRLVAVMIIDLNGFKAVNDALGHGGGDQLLRHIGGRLKKRLRDSDTVARLGGDEFAILIEDLARPEHARIVATKLLDAVAPPVELQGRKMSVTASLGIAIWPQDTDAAGTLMALADRAMYRAKAEGGNRCCFASAELEQKVEQGALIREDLARALAGCEFTLFYQPQVNLTKGLIGIAALPRWVHPEQGVLAPDRFLGLVEESGFVADYTGWLIESVLDQAAAWRAQGALGFSIALPLTMMPQLRWNDLGPRLRAGLEQRSLPPAILEIELGENLIQAQTDDGGRPLKRLKAIGVRVALDRFGSGTVSLKALRTPGLNTLKLDRELIAGIGHGSRETALVDTLIALGHRLDLRIVAEGADTTEQAEHLRRQGCHAIQAFLRCPPLSPEACTGWLGKACERARRELKPDRRADEAAAS